MTMLRHRQYWRAEAMGKAQKDVGVGDTGGTGALVSSASESTPINLVMPGSSHNVKID
jgi:hypothetical protein